MCVKDGGPGGRGRTGARRRRPALVSAAVSLVVAVSATIPAYPSPPPAAEIPGVPVPAPSRATRPASACPDGALVPAKIVVDGTGRSYLVSAPEGGPRRAMVIAFHGLAGRTRPFAELTGLCGLTRAAGQILVLPDSAGPAFNDGRLGRRGPHDDAFAMALIARYVRRGLVNPDRVTVAGFSNGAGMAMAVASRHPRQIAAVVSVDGSLLSGSGAPRPTGPVQAVLLHGSADRVQPWNGRRGHSRFAPAYVPVPTTVDSWVVADRCRGASRVLLAAPVEAGPRGAGKPGRRGPAGTPVEVTRWLPGPGGASVSFYRLIGGGHRWPVGDPRQVRPGTALAAVDASRIIVETAAGALRPAP